MADSGVLSRLPINGGTMVGGSSAFASYLPILNANGLLNSSLIEGDGAVVIGTNAEDYLSFFGVTLDFINPVNTSGGLLTTAIFGIENTWTNDNIWNGDMILFGDALILGGSTKIDWNGDTSISRLGPASLSIDSSTVRDGLGTLIASGFHIANGYGFNAIGDSQFSTLTVDGTTFDSSVITAAGNATNSTGGLVTDAIFGTDSSWTGTQIFRQAQIVSFGQFILNGAPIHDASSIDFSGSGMGFRQANVSILGIASLAIGNGTAGDTSGNITLANVHASGGIYMGGLIVAGTTFDSSVITAAGNSTNTSNGIAVYDGSGDLSIGGIGSIATEFNNIISGTTEVGHAQFADNATNDASGNNIASTYISFSDEDSLSVSFATSADTAGTALTANNAENDGSGNNIQSTYASLGSTPNFNGANFEGGNLTSVDQINNGGGSSFLIDIGASTITLADNSTDIDFSSQASLKSTLGPIVNPVYFQRLTADSAGVTGMTPAAPSTGGISVTLPAGTYKFDAGIIVGTASTTSGVQLQMNSASGDNFTYACIFGPSNTSPNWFGGNVAGVGNYAVLFADAPTTSSQCISTGILVVATSGTYIAVVAQRTAVDLSNPIFIKAGSWVRFEKQ